MRNRVFLIPMVIILVLSTSLLMGHVAGATTQNAEYDEHDGALHLNGGISIEDCVASPGDGKFIQMDADSRITMLFPGDIVAAPDGTASADLRVHIYDALFPANATIEVSLDGSSWTTLGEYEDTANIDLDLDGIGPAKYVRIDQNGYYIDPAYPGLGFDLDAVVAINAEPYSITVPLCAGQSIPVGNVTITDDGEGNLTVRYQTIGDWVMIETHLDVQEDWTDFPMTRKSQNPKVGHFGNKTDHGPYPWTNDFTYYIDVSDLDNTLAIAAHAKVQLLNTVCIDFEEYEEKDQVSTMTTPNGDVNFYMGNMTFLEGLTIGDSGNLTAVEDMLPIVAEPLTYYSDQTATNYDRIVAFTYDGTPYRDDWVFDAAGTGAGGKTLTDPQDLDQTELMWHAYSQYLAIVVDVSDIEAIQGVSLAAIDLDHLEEWHFQYFDEQNHLIHEVVLGPGVSGGDGKAFAVQYSNPAISKLAIWGIRPSSSDPQREINGYAIDNICITSVVQEETAWGDGCAGTSFPGNNWATYFEYMTTATWLDNES